MSSPWWVQATQLFQMENAMYTFFGLVTTAGLYAASRSAKTKFDANRAAEKDALNSEVNILKTQRIDQLQGMLADCRLSLDRLTHDLEAAQKELNQLKNDNYLAQLRVQQLEQFIVHNNLVLPAPSLIG